MKRYSYTVRDKKLDGVLELVWTGNRKPTDADFSHALEILSEKDPELMGDEQEKTDDQDEPNEYSDIMSQKDFEQLRKRQEARGQKGLVTHPKRIGQWKPGPRRPQL
jgi:hypothetical protein